MTATLHRASRWLAYVLRHAPREYGLHMDSEGWVDVQQLISADSGYRLTHDVVTRIVEEDDKQRYQLNDTGTLIRAVQGHTAIARVYQPEVPPSVLYHGTKQQALRGILGNGLLPMQRSHVHMSADVATAEEVASRRKGANVILQIDSLAAYSKGVTFYRSENGVWLCGAIPPEFITIKKPT